MGYCVHPGGLLKIRGARQGQNQEFVDIPSFASPPPLLIFIWFTCFIGSQLFNDSSCKHATGYFPKSKIYTNINDRTLGRNASLWLIDLLSLCVFGKRRCNVYKLGVCSEDETKDDIKINCSIGRGWIPFGRGCCNMRCQNPGIAKIGSGNTSFKKKCFLSGIARMRGGGQGLARIKKYTLYIPL